MAAFACHWATRRRIRAGRSIRVDARRIAALGCGRRTHGLLRRVEPRRRTRGSASCLGYTKVFDEEIADLAADGEVFGVDDGLNMLGVAPVSPSIQLRSTGVVILAAAAPRVSGELPS